MPIFRCRVSDVNGTMRTLLREAPSAEIAGRELEGDGLFVVAIEAGSQEAARPRVRLQLVREFTDSLSTLLAAGLTVSDALEVQQSVFENRDGGTLIGFLRRRLERGSAFSSALEEVGGAFSSVYCGLVRIGERIGSISRVMSRLSVYLRKRKQIRDKLLGSLTYPAIVLLVAVAGAGFIGTIVLPRVRGMFEALGSAVPDSAIDATDSLAVIALVLSAVLALAVVAIGVLLVSRRGRGGEAVDRLILRLPLVGEVLLRQEVLNFVFAMETLTESGVPIEAALREASRVFHNRALAEVAGRVVDRVVDGTELSTAVAESSLLPRRLAIWTRIGERTGNAGAVFGQLRVYYEEEMNRWIERFMTLVEPALIVGVGVVLLVLVLTFVVPLFSVFGSIL